MLTEICAETRNYFLVPNGIHQGSFTVRNGTLSPLDFLAEGQYFRIVGSAFNDGVHQYPAADLIDESFVGSVWAMAVPPYVIALADKIKGWAESDAAKPSAFQSESFGGYSYTRATATDGKPLTWQSVFAPDLNKIRRISVL